jgi:hypothetical protein
MSVKQSPTDWIRWIGLIRTIPFHVFFASLLTAAMKCGSILLKKNSD